MVELRHQLLELGHEVFYAERVLDELGMDVRRIARLVDKTGANAWIVSAASRVVLEWFATRPEPTFARFGRYDGLPLAGAKPDKLPALDDAIRRLVDLGHRRIVLLTRRRRRLPTPGKFERRFLATLEAQGITTGEFNLPDWDESPAGFRKVMDSLFRHTPPSALILDEAPFFTAALQFLTERGLRIPGEVSLLCSDPDPSFAWCEPPIAHISWNSSSLIRAILRWADHVNRGMIDQRQTLTRARFIPGGTIGPAPLRRRGSSRPAPDSARSGTGRSTPRR